MTPAIWPEAIHHKTFLARKMLGRRIGTANRHDSGSTEAVHIDRDVYLAQIHLLPTDHRLATLDEIVLKIGVAQVYQA